MVLPMMTPEQRSDALAKAVEARQARSTLLARVKSRDLTPGQVFERTEDEIVKKTRVQQVLRALPGYGPAKVAALMTESGVDEKRRVGGLTGAQRERLLAAVTASGADGRASDTSHDREKPTPPGQDLRQALQEQLGQVFQPVFDELQHQFADAVRHQLEQALHPTGEESEGEVDAVAQPPHRPGRDQTEQTPPQPGGPTEENGRQLKAAEQDEAAPRSAGILGMASVTLQETTTRLVNALQGLLQTVGSLLQTVASWLRWILVTLREGFRSVVGRGAGAVTS